MKITIVGAGMVGSTTALRLIEDRLADELVLVDVAAGLAKAVALDLAQAAPLRGHTVAVTGGSDFAPTEGSDLVIVTAGLPRKPGQSRADLLAANGEIIRGVAGEVARRCPDAVLIVVTNPLDEMTTLAWRVSGFPATRVVGMAGVLDTARFRYFVARELAVPPDTVSALVLGSHGETMVPLPRLTRIGGRPLSSLLPREQIAGLVSRTREAGAEIVALLPRGSAWLAPSAAIADMAAAIVRDERRLVSACARLNGEYGLSEVFLGVPVRLGRGGVGEIVELPLESEELAALRAAADTVRARVAGLDAPRQRPTRTPPAAPGPPDGRAAGPETASVKDTVDAVAAMRLRSQVRRAVTQVLWARGNPVDPRQVESLTDAVVGRIGGAR